MEYAVKMTGISKSFGTVKAVDKAEFALKKGEIHVLLGENGAGKTTLMKMLYGMIKPDGGEIYIHGKKASFDSPKEAIENGINMVHQHFMLAEYLTVTENIVIGKEPGKTMAFHKKDAVKLVKELGETYQLDIEPERMVKDLPVGEQQRVEILKALYREAEILILDEPTAVLTPQEVNQLFSVIKRLKDAGKSIILITHKLKETLEIADRISVLRDGKVIAYRMKAEEANAEQLADLMVGRKVQLHVHRANSCAGEEIYTAENIGLRERNEEILKEITLRLNKGEILGIAGIEGNGQTELIEILCGIRRPTSGKLLMNGKELKGTVKDFLQNRVGHIPEDRSTRGLVLSMGVEENLILGYHHFPQFQHRGILRKKYNRQMSQEAIQKYYIKASGAEQSVGALSGGNQQKVVIARVLSQNPNMLIAAQPTRGVDVGAMEYIHNMLLDLRDSKKAVLLISADLDEVRSLSDRIAVIYEGRIVCEKKAEEFTEVELGLYMAGGKGA